MKSNSHSPKEPKTSFHVYFTFEREKKDPVVMHSDITVRPLAFLYSPVVPFLVQKLTTPVSHPGCAATAQTGVQELRLRPETLWVLEVRQKLPPSNAILDPQNLGILSHRFCFKPRT